MASLRTFGANIYLLIALLLAGGVLLCIVIASWTSLRVWLWNRAVRRAENARQRERTRPDGRPYPPSTRGLCDRCGQVRAKVYHLPSGERLCVEHYNGLEEPPPGTDRGGEQDA